MNFLDFARIVPIIRSGGYFQAASQIPFLERKNPCVKFSALKASIDEEMRNGFGRRQQMTKSSCENKTKCGVQTRYMESHFTGERNSAKFYFSLFTPFLLPRLGVLVHNPPTNPSERSTTQIDLASWLLLGGF